MQLNMPPHILFIMVCILELHTLGRDHAIRLSVGFRVIGLYL